MKKYLLVAKNSLAEYFSYRLNFILWRVRVVVTILVSFSLWQAIFKTNSQLFGYRQSQILTYILLLNFINGVVLCTQTMRVASEINTGVLSKFLVQPLNYFAFNFFRDLSDKAINTLFSFLEITLLFLILKPSVILQTNFFLLSFFILATVFASVLYFEISMLLSFIGFWSKEVWAPRFIFYIIIAFLAGTYFPLDILPLSIYNILQFLPFTYLVFFPLKIYLGSIDMVFLSKGFLILSAWIFLLWIFLNYLWREGLKVYTAEGS